MAERHRSGKQIIAALGLYVAGIAFIFSACGAIGLLGDGGGQRLEDLLYAVIAAVVMYVCRRQMLKPWR